MRKLYDRTTMAQIKVTVADDEGVVIGIHDYDLAKGLDTLSKMKGAIEELRPQMLSDINKDLLDIIGNKQNQLYCINDRI